MSLGQLEEQNKFRKSLSQYWVSKGITQIKIPQIGGQQLNLYKLYKSVCKKGGGQTVSQNKMWKEIVDQFGLPSTCTSASFTLKNHYQKYLLAYEQKYLFGKQDTAQVPQLVAGRNRKNMKDDLDFIGLPHKYPLSRNEGYQINTSTLSSELKKAYDKTDHNQKISYIKRTKMYPVISEVKHMMMAFQSPQHQQNIYAINILTLFSVNTQAPFLFSQYPFVVDSIAIYLERVYPTQNIQILQCIRNLTLAIRNLAINHKNLQPILESPLVQIFLKIFQQKGDKEVTRNVLDIFSSLSKVGWDCKQLFVRMQGYLERDSYQDLQTGIDLLRSLVQQKQQMCQNIIFDRIQFFSRLIIHTSIQIRVAILQIFAYLSDKSQRTRRCCLTNFKFMERIFAVMSPGDRYANKQSQLACYIVNNIAQSPCNYPLLRKFEKKLALVSFNSEILAPITTDILFKLSGRKEVRATHEQNSVLVNVRNKINHRSENQDSSQYDD